MATDTLLNAADTLPTGSSKVPPSEYTGDAASRVFAVPELLEHILFTGVTDQYNQAITEKKIHLLKMWPMPGCGPKQGICLFAVQRVSKDFRYTIQGSTKLKQLIFLAPLDNDELLAEEKWKGLGWKEVPYHDDHMSREERDSTWLPLHQPLTSMLLIFASKVDRGLFEFHGSPHNKTEFLWMDLGSGMFYERIEPGEIPVTKFPKGWHNPEASWRKILMCNAKTQLPVKIQIWHDYWWINDWLALPFNVLIELGEDSTLERVFNCFSELLMAAQEMRDFRLDWREEQELAEERLSESCPKEGEEGMEEYKRQRDELSRKYDAIWDAKETENNRQLYERLKAVAES
ncbi:hypothetical protein CKM354_001037500 [Cercospora kikuchii]|uniref:Uncharacterized protein n=1 Tax=Cercospora kikuchii TaxID=84275 RepID=A0A9P3FKK5_9PEZI|nr:uncharacterized protein CKM354_001037500 [Cercospora kikuchii]GIZ47279.1 hypothetical protein CKM354_001037500 [Cercospora kikuchii]